MNIINKVDFFYKQAQSKDNSLNILLNNYKLSCEGFLTALELAYNDYFSSLGKSEANKKRAQQYNAAIQNAKKSIPVLIKAFLDTKKVDFIEQINILIFSAAEFSRTEELQKWFNSTNHSPARITRGTEIVSKGLQVKEAYANLKNYIYK